MEFIDDSLWSRFKLIPALGHCHPALAGRTLTENLRPKLYLTRAKVECREAPSDVVLAKLWPIRPTEEHFSCPHSPATCVTSCLVVSPFQHSKSLNSITMSSKDVQLEWLVNRLWVLPAALVAILFLRGLTREVQKRRHMPAWPCGTAFIGNRHQMPARKPWRKFADLNKEYGTSPTSLRSAKLTAEITYRTSCISPLRKDANRHTRYS